LREVVTGREGRCGRCYRERLGRAAARARELACDAFTTTLLISRHQDQREIRAAAAVAAAAAGVTFFDVDLREWDAESHRLAREMGLYVQGYCGCIYSEEERYRRRRPADDTAGD
jgi:predicted adenine nucleotide alpha hydrolase (AANH) superfamily ATPase